MFINNFIFFSPFIVYNYTQSTCLFNIQFVSQIYVAGVVSLLFLDLGMILVAPTIIIGELHNTKDGLSLDDNQASWLGK